MTIPPIGLEQARDVVTRKVFINNQELNAEIPLLQITVDKSFNKIAFAKMIFHDGSTADRDFPLSNNNIFKPGNSIKVQLGYSGSVDTVFDGIIVKHGIKLRANAASLLQIEAKDKAIKLTAARKNVYHLNKTDSTVISDLAVGLRKDVDPTTLLHKQLVQFNATDWDFIVTRAEANGMFVWTDDGKLVVKKPIALGVPSFIAVHGQNIWEFEAEMDARRQVQSVTSESWDYTQQQPLTSGNGSSMFVEAGNISSNELGSVLGGEVKLRHSGNLTRPQLQSWSDAHALRNKLSKAVGRVRIEGNASIKPGSIITLQGVGDRFNGSVFVTGVLHHYEGHWQTDIQFGWREEWFYKKEDIMDRPAAGLLPGVNGLQIGVVKDVNDQEDGGQYRVKVHIPLVTTTNAGIWARVAAIDAGANHGVYFRPQVDDEVILGFLNDDPREAIVLGYLHSKNNRQSPLPEQQGGKQYGVVTKEGLKLVFDDTNKRMTLVVPTSSGNKSVILNDTSGGIEIKDEFSNTIKMGSQGITIEAGASKNVTIKGTFVNIN